MPSKPYLIIVAGPTASGKGSAPSKIQNYLNLSTNHKTVLIDNLVEANPHYKKGVQKFIDTKRKEGLSNVDIYNIFSNPTPEDIQTFNNLYFESRKNTNCHTGEMVESTRENPSSEICDAVNDAILDNAFKNNENIVFETTGEWWPGWLFDKYKSHIKEGNYDIIMAYSIVSLCELLFRNKSRAVQSIREFLRNDKATPPRLPDIRFDKYRAGLSKIIETFKTHNFKCSNEKDEICVRFIIFDNRSRRLRSGFVGRDSTVLYDSFSENAIDKGNKIIDLYTVESSVDCEPPTSATSVEGARVGTKRQRHQSSMISPTRKRQITASQGPTSAAASAAGGKRRSYKRKKSKRKRNSIKRKRKSIKRKIKY